MLRSAMLPAMTVVATAQNDQFHTNRSRSLATGGGESPSANSALPTKPGGHACMHGVCVSVASREGGERGN